MPEALIGLALGYVVGIVLISVVAAATRHGGHSSTYGENVASLFGLWTGLLGAVLAVSASAHRSEPARRPLAERLRDDFGLAFVWTDVPLGIAIGLGAQYLLVPLLELPLVPFVPNLSHRLSQPAQQLTGGVHGPGIVFLAVLICCGSPLVEELFFRGLLLRAMLRVFARAGRLFGPLLGTVVTGVLFGLAHAEWLQLAGLAAFGVVLSVMAWRLDRLGPCICAHAVFNLVAVLSVATGR